MTTTTSTPPAGWYQDPENASLQRWWDGTSWTADQRPAEQLVVAPYGQHLAVPSSSASTPWAWILALVPLVSIVLAFAFGVFAYWPLVDAGIPEDLVSIAYLPIAYAVVWVSAVLDWRALGRRGFPRPNLAWVLLLPPVAYLVARGRGLRTLGIKSTAIEVTFALCFAATWLANAGLTYLATQL